MFQVEMLPAREGDALWIRYGDKDAPRQILVDAGRAATYSDIKSRLAKLPPDQRNFELFVITHIDRDHIEGALKLLEDDELLLSFKEVWFNGYDHLRDVKLETFGAYQGERLSTALMRRKEKWNASFGGGAVRLNLDGSLPVVPLAGGMTMTVLSPDVEKLRKLEPKWEEECEAAGIQPGIEARIKDVEGLESFGSVDVDSLIGHALKPDDTLPNGSSIALLAEYDGIRVLLGADAHLDRLTRSMQALAVDGMRVRLDAFKLPHHGSSGNVSEALLGLIDCPRYLISTNGSYFKHPTREAIARLLAFGGPNKTLYFNYDNKFTDIWKDFDLQQDYDYLAAYPEGDDGTLLVTL